MAEQRFNSSFDSLLRLPQVLAVIPVSKSSWWQGVKNGRYPQPLKLGPRTTCWRKSDIVAFIENVGKQSTEEMAQTPDPEV